MNSELRVGLHDLEFRPSFTVEELSINPWKSSLMDVDDDDLMVADSGVPSAPSGSSSSRPVVMIKTQELEDLDEVSM